MLHDLDALHIASASWREHDLLADMKRNDAFFLDEVAQTTTEPVGGRHQRLARGLVEKNFAKVRMSDLDQGPGSLPHGFAKQVGYPELGHHIMHIRACQRDPFTCEKGGSKAGSLPSSVVDLRQTIGLPPQDAAAPR